MASTEKNLEAARRYLAALARMAPPDEVAEFFDPAVVQQEYPNRLTPNGAVRGLAELRAAGEAGRRVTTAQSYEILNAVASGDNVALQVLWTGTLAVPVGSLTAGDNMVAHLSVFLEFRDGRIIRQHNYDCFEPF